MKRSEAIKIVVETLKRSRLNGNEMERFNEREIRQAIDVLDAMEKEGLVSSSHAYMGKCECTGPCDWDCE